MLAARVQRLRGARSRESPAAARAALALAAGERQQSDGRRGVRAARRRRLAGVLLHQDHRLQLLRGAARGAQRTPLPRGAPLQQRRRDSDARRLRFGAGPRKRPGGADAGRRPLPGSDRGRDHARSPAPLVPDRLVVGHAAGRGAARDPGSPVGSRQVRRGAISQRHDPLRRCVPRAPGGDPGGDRCARRCPQLGGSAGRSQRDHPAVGGALPG